VNFHFSRQFRIFPALPGTVSRSGPGLTVGVAGFHLSYSRGRLSRLYGLPGSGIFVTSRMGLYTGFHSAHIETPVGKFKQTLIDTGAALLTIGAIALMIVLVFSVLAWMVD